MSTPLVGGVSSIPAYQEFISQQENDTNEQHNAEPSPLAGADAVEDVPSDSQFGEVAPPLSPSPPPSQATPQASPKKSQAIIDHTQGALSLLANEISYQGEDEHDEADVFDEPSGEIKRTSTNIVEPKSKEKVPSRSTLESSPEEPRQHLKQPTRRASGHLTRRSPRIASTKTKSTVTLGDLIDAGLLEPGKDVEYKDETGILLKDGWIEWYTDKYADPQTWAVGVAKSEHASTKPMMQSDMWQEVRYDGQTLEELRQKYIREGYSELSSAKVKKRILNRYNTAERRLIFGDDEGSSDYGSSAAANDGADQEDEEESADVDAMQIVDSEGDEEDGGHNRQKKAKASHSHAKEKRQKPAKRKSPSSHEDEQAEEPAKKKAKREKRRQKESESSVDDAFFVESLVSSSAPPQSLSLRPDQQNTLPTSATQPKQSSGSSSSSKRQSPAPSSKDKKLNRPASLELLPSSLSNVGTAEDEDEDILGDEVQEIQPARLRSRIEPDDSGFKLLEKLPPKRESVEDEPWLDTSEEPAAPLSKPAVVAQPPKKPSIKREQTVHIEPEVQEKLSKKKSDVAAPPKRKSSAGLQRTGSGDDLTRDGQTKQLQRRIDEIFIKSEDPHQNVDVAPAQQPLRTPSEIAMPPPAISPKAKQPKPAGVNLQRVKEKDAGTTTGPVTIANGPGPIIVGSGLKHHMMSQMASLVSKLGGELRTEVGQDVTHLVILPSSEGVASRTLKYLQAVVNGSWILSYQWILDSLREQKYQPESKYLINADNKAEGAPAKARKHKKKCNTGLFDGFEIHFHGAFPPGKGPKLEELKWLARLGGATVLNVAPDPPKDLEEARLERKLIIGHVDMPVLEAKRVWEHTGFNPITFLWMFDCISNFDIIDTSDYRIFIDLPSTGDGFEQSSLAF